MEYLLILVSMVIDCVLISTFTSLVGIPIGTSSSVGLKSFIITAWIKKYKSIARTKGKDTW